jgi:formylglycine-generating enzyme required for sulfatase activity
MAGNVWEWTASLYKPYPYDAEDGREHPEPADKRVKRGGAYLNERFAARCANRYDYSPDDRRDYFGFRACVSAALLPGS